ncbi:transcription initiation factor TFIID subunit 1-A-like protein [Corchorus olitorius]|uniref:Transcription initiation factor TFIID subunit 1-A-like protein n=1 Tax=Corchorus olitorius TaxID=93759 RepID=A0A1R3KQP1_9ROSI|nr:transcription initiation factor TFIID subunit 1-A-like protein [Corchorus olitorius]
MNLENGFLVIRINVEDWLRSQKFESKNDHVSVANAANTEVVTLSKALARLPNPIIPPSVDIVTCHESMKFQLPFCLKVNLNHLTVENSGFDSDGYGTPGSPCFSVHSRSTDEINMILEEEANYREVSIEFGNVDNVLDSDECCDGHMTLPEGECESLDDVIDDNESLKVANGLLSTSRNTESAIVVSDSEMTAIRMTSINESVVALESIVDHTQKKPRRRKNVKTIIGVEKESYES